jgi:hypothetical protein
MSMFHLSRRERALVRFAPITEKSDLDRRMRVAVLRARRHKTGGPELAQQQTFDKAMAQLVRDIPVSAEIAEWFRNEKLIPQKKRSWKKVARNPVVLTIALAVLVMAGIATMMIMERLNDFPGSGRARKLLTLASTTRGAELDRVQTDAGALSDLFFLKYRLEHYDVPPEFAHVRTAGVRVFHDEGVPVAQVSVPEKRMQFFLFPAQRDLKSGEPQEFDGWRYLSHDGWSGVVQVRDGVCFMAAVRGDQKELQPYIAAGERAAAAEASPR